jgi:hypothetical protein
MMGTPVAVLSGGTRGFELGLFKNGSVAQGFNFPLTTNYKWWNGVDVLSSQYLIYTDKYTMGSSTLADTIPVAWSTPDLNDSSLLALINTLPPRVGLPGFTDLDAALDWLQGTSDFYLVKTGYDNIVTTNLQLLYDAGYYNSYVGTGTSVIDLSGNNRTGTLTNGTGFISSGVGTFDFDGSDDYITSSLATNANNNVTIDAWFNSDNVNQAGQMIVYNGSDSGGNGYGISINYEGSTSGNLYVLYGALSWFDTGIPLSSGVWYYGAMTISGTSLKVYLNGVLIYSTTSSNPNTPTSYTNIGRNDYSDARYFNGKIPIARVYTTTLTADQVLQNYNAQKGRFGIYGQVTNGQALKLDASNPASYSGSGAEWYDISGFANNAELLNGPTFSSDGGGSINFDGTDDRARIPQTNSLYGNTFTWEFWVKFDAFPNTYSGIVWAEGSTGGGSGLQYLFSLQDNSGTRFFHYRISNTSTGWANTDTSTINFTPTDWVHIVWTFDNGTTKIYTQGSLFHTNTTRGSYNGGTDSPIFIGGRNDSFGSLDGKYGLTNYYNRALLASEIVQNFESKRNQFSVTGVSTNNLIFWLDAGNYASYNGSGTTWYDMSGNVLDATLLNGPSYSTDGGGSLSLDGSDDVIRVLGSQTALQNIGTGDFTMCLWVKINSSQTGSEPKILFNNKNAPAAAAGYGFDYFYGGGNNGKLLWSTANGSSSVEIFSQNSFTSILGTWAYVVMVRQNGASNNGHFYVNGVYESLASSATVLNVNTSTNMTLGNTADSFSGYFTQGNFGNAQIYNRALSSSEVLQNFNAQKNRYGL